MPRKHPFKKYLLIALGILLILQSLHYFQTRNTLTEVRSSWEAMDTIFDICLIVPVNRIDQANNCIGAIQRRVKEIEKKGNFFDPASELSRINNYSSSGTAVHMDSEMFYWLSTSVEYSHRSGGAFDITVGPYTTIFVQARDNNKSPSSAELAIAQSLVGYQYLELDQKAQTIIFAKRGMLLDLGGMLKGYVLDEVDEIVTSAGMKRGYINAGGSFALWGKDIKGNLWPIAMRDPQHPERTMQTRLLTDCFVSTSGGYERYVTVGDRTLTHIFEPHTGTTIAKATGVTVIAPKGVVSDILSTAFILMEEKKARALADREGVEGVFY